MGLPKSPLKGKKFLERKQEEDWLRRCLPIIVQPELDIRAGHPLECVFFKFRREENDISCEVSLIFQGEATYAPPCCNRDVPPSVSQCMTYGYRTWNRFAYERTADINSFIYLGISFSDRKRPYSDIWMCDASGSSPQRSQSWANGDKMAVSGCFTVHNHFVLEASFETWATWGGGEGGDSDSEMSSTKTSLPSSSTRPLVYLNTCNHMMGFWDANQAFPKFHWTRYCVCRGGRGLAETYAQKCLRVKPNFMSVVVCDHVIDFFSVKSDAEKEMVFLLETGIEVKLWERQKKPVFKASPIGLLTSSWTTVSPLTKTMDRSGTYKRVNQTDDRKAVSRTEIKPKPSHPSPPSPVTSSPPSPPSQQLLVPSPPSLSPPQLPRPSSTSQPPRPSSTSQPPPGTNSEGF